MPAASVVPRAAVTAIFSSVASNFLAERDRWFLWLPVALGLGIGLYFIMPSEPPLWLGGTVAVLAAAAGFSCRPRPVLAVMCLAAATGAVGFAAAQIRTVSVHAPVLTKRTAPVDITGRVVELQVRAKRTRIVLDRLTVPGLRKTATPERVRLRVHGPMQDIRPGRRISVRAVLLPLPGPAAPGAFDFQRYAYFKRIGAIGYSLAPVRLAGGAGSPASDRLWLRRLRQDVAARIRAALPGSRGAVAAALLTGQRGAIPDDTLTAIRDSGLAHLLAISGLHIGLVAGLVFFLVRALLAAIPSLALRYPIKKWAAVAALAGAFLYLLLSGATIPTQRAYLMLAIVMVGVLTDRIGLSLRLVAWAAVAVLLVQPESLLSASFQMSFAAVVALVAAYEALRDRLVSWREHSGPVRKSGRYVVGVGLTTVIAGLATAPFAVYHFNRLAAYGLVANLVAVPITAFWIMPFGLLALCLMPVGLDQYALVPMGWGIDALIAVARTVSGWPGAAKLFPSLPVHGLLLVVAGAIWLALWRRRWRLWGVPLILAGLVAGGLVRPPDILISRSGKLLAARAADGRLMLSTARAGRFTGNIWLRREGQAERTLWPKTGLSKDGRIRCDGLGCIYRAGGEVVALIRDPRALPDDCRRATLVILAGFPGPACPSAHTVIHRANISRDGGHALWLPRTGWFGASRLRVVSDRGLRGRRPWVPPPPRWTGRYRLNEKGNVLVRDARLGQKLRNKPTRRP